MSFDISKLYFSTAGRIGRQEYWIGAIVLGIVSIIVSIVLTSTISGTAALVIGIIWQLLISYPAYHLLAKRFQDRNKPATYALYAVVAFFVLAVISLLVAPVPGEAPGTISIIVSVITLAIGIWLLIELGILRGTVGPNQYGPDPVGP